MGLIWNSSWRSTMAKGFGVKADQQLGYVLDLMPSAHAYAT
jgi:hypothetical protein